MITPKAMAKATKSQGHPEAMAKDYASLSGSWASLDDVGAEKRQQPLVINEMPGEIFLHHFWLVTSWPKDEKNAEELVSHYRERGSAEGIFGELMDGIEPTLSSNKRPKSHYKGRILPKKVEKNLTFAINEVRLILSALAYNLAHAVRCAAQEVMQVGMRI